MLSDVDTLNTPMIHAMRRAGHTDSDWQSWEFRTRVAEILSHGSR